MAFKKFTRHVGLGLAAVDLPAMFVRINDQAPQVTWCNYARICDGSLYAIKDDWHGSRCFCGQHVTPVAFGVVATGYERHNLLPMFVANQFY